MNSYSEEHEKGLSGEFQENLGILRQIEFFSGLPIETVKVFTYLCTRERFKQGDLIFSQDDDDGQAVYILSGTADLVREEQTAEVLIRSYKRDAFLGGLALLGTMRRLFSLKASTDVTCLVLTRSKFLKAMEQFPGLWPRVANVMVGGIRLWEERFFEQHAKHSEACLKRIGVTLL
jgi:CRP-like cAMP-binding protein